MKNNYVTHQQTTTTELQAHSYRINSLTGLINQMDTNRDTSNKNTEWTWPGTCISLQKSLK